MNKIIAMLRQAEIAKKTRKEQSSGYASSQWDGMTRESRLIKKGHLQSKGMSLSEVRAENKKKKELANKIETALLIKKGE